MLSGYRDVTHQSPDTLQSTLVNGPFQSMVHTGPESNLVHSKLYMYLYQSVLLTNRSTVYSGPLQLTVHSSPPQPTMEWFTLVDGRLQSTAFSMVSGPLQSAVQSTLVQSTVNSCPRPFQFTFHSTKRSTPVHGNTTFHGRGTL